MLDERAEGGAAEAAGGVGLVQGVDEDGQRLRAVLPVEGFEERTDGVGPNAGGCAQGVEDVCIGQALGIHGGIQQAGGEETGRQAEGVEGDGAAAFGVGEGGDQAEDGGLARARSRGHYPARGVAAALAGAEPGGEVGEGGLAAAEPPSRFRTRLVLVAVVAHGADQQPGNEFRLPPPVLFAEGGLLLHREVDRVQTDVMARIGEERRRLPVQTDHRQADPLMSGPRR
ncbi:hypothetical protein ABZX62_26835 [Streptomyces flavidovirens]|uniref:hypothetical protein n=1 Tax=Streptomyces flavidovirens TaxID=67298 RepID=UPI0033BA2EDB